MNWDAVVWTAIAIVGLILSSILIRYARHDRRVLEKAQIGNGRVALATTWLVSECCRSVMHILFGSVGLGVLLGLDLPYSKMLIAGNSLVIVNSLLGIRYRRLLDEHRRDDDRPETAIERQDREVGDTRREGLLRDPDTVPTPEA